MEKILTGKDLAEERGARCFREWAMWLAAERYRQGQTAHPWNGKLATGGTVEARIDFGRWIADCPECKGAEYVDPEDPFFFCQSCGNASLKGTARRVRFPRDRGAIEAAVLERPVKELNVKGKLTRALTAKPVFLGLSRSWKPGESVAELKRQERAAKDLTPSPFPDPLSGAGGKGSEEVKDG